MPRTLRSFVVLFVVMAAFLAARVASQAQDLSLSDLADGPYARMYMLLEKTIFGFDVLTLEIRVDPGTQDRLERLARNQAYSAELARRATAVVLDAPNASITLRFVRDVDFDRWLEGARDGVAQAARANLIPRETARDVAGRLPRWFAPVVDRGFLEGDRILYRIHPDRLRTLVVSQEGAVLVDQTDVGAIHGRTVLAGFLAPGTDFREPLVRSLLGN
jgi:hypothetical protein